MVAHLETHIHATVVVLDNRFLDPLGQPHVCTEEAAGSSERNSWLQLEALTCNGSYQRDIRIVLAVPYECPCPPPSPSSSSTERQQQQQYMFCEVIVESAELHPAAAQRQRGGKGEEGSVVLDEEGDEEFVWNEEAEQLLEQKRQLLASSREQGQQEEQEQQHGEQEQEKRHDTSVGTAEQVAGGASSAGVARGIKTESFYAGCLRDFFTRCRSWSRIEAGEACAILFRA